MKRILSFVLTLALLLSFMPTGLFTITASAATSDFSGGKGTADSPYLISTATHLDNVRYYCYKGAYFKLTCNIYLGSRYWTPIGQYSSEPFTGTFDGSGFIIDTLDARRATETQNVAGLFGYNEGVIKNLCISGGTVSGYSSSVSNNTSSSSYVGGIVGYNKGTIMNCYNMATISASASGCGPMSYAGGIAGYNKGTIMDCYNVGKVNASAENISTLTKYAWASAGGIAGENRGTIERCYNIAAVAASVSATSPCPYAGGIVGKNNSGSITNCYYLNSTIATGSGGYTAEQLGQQVTYVGFDFENIWVMDTTIQPYPFLRTVHCHIYENACDDKCDTCGYKRVTRHTYIWIIDQEATCERNGIKHEECTGCHAVRSANTVIASNHSYDNVCDTICNLCQRTREAPHSYKWIIDQQENCGKNGVKHEECSICFSKRNENTQIAATGNHTFTDGNDIECNVCKQGFVRIQFNSNGGTGISTIRTLPDQMTALHTAVPTRAGYNFVGWSTTKAGNALYQAGDSLQTDKSITLYAQWNKHCDSCSGTGKITCNSCSGAGTKEVTETCTNCNGGKYCFACCSRWTYYTGWDIIRYCGGYTLNNDRDTYYVEKLTCPYCGRGFTVPDYMANWGINKSEIDSIIVGLIAYNILLECEVCSGIGKIISRVQCSKCDGSRQAECSDCAGSGEATRTNVSAPAAPTLKNVTANTVTLNAITNGEYSVGGDIWQESPTFDNLEEGQVYRFHQRYAKTETTYASYSSIALTVLVHEHTFDNACDDTCNLCDDIRTVPDHTYDNACDEDCNTCGNTRPITHNYEWVIDKENNCSIDGLKHEECSVCHATQNTDTVIPATGNHLYDNNCDAVCEKCGLERSVPDHIYDNACDVACNECGTNRTVPDHIYDNACDANCNECELERSVPGHVYDNPCDADCNVCHQAREVGPHFVSDKECYSFDNDMTYPYALVDGWYISTNKKNSSSASVTLTATSNGSVTALYKISSEKTYDKFVIKKNGTVLATASGAVMETEIVVDLSTGDVLTFTYSKDSSLSRGNDEASFKIVPLSVDANALEADCLHPVICSGCGVVVKPVSAEHTYANVCDTTCNICGIVRTAPHIYDNEKDHVCNECGYVAYISGDLTGDGKINSLDGLLLMRYLNGWNVNIASPEAMDVNSDGKVNSLDGLILMRYLNGWNVTLG